MNRSRLAASFLLATVLVSGSSFAQADKKPAAPVVSAAAKTAYPLATCVVSDDKLDDVSMGGPVDYLYKQAGKPDRLVRFCCKDCVKDFEKEPAKYLKKIDEAAAKKAKAPAPKQ